MSDKKAIITETDNELAISSEGLTIFIKEGGHSVSFRSEDYGLKFKFDFYIDINNSYENWDIELMEFVGKLLKKYNGDFVLETNGDSVYIMRKNEDGIVIVDDTKLGFFPFDSMGIQYKKEKLKLV
jgi:hypothetical protein